MKLDIDVSPGDGRAALALVLALMQHLENDGKLIPKDRKNIIAAAGHMISISGRYNDEAKKVLAALAKVA